MSRQREVNTWPFVVVLSALFLLSVAAPRSWEKIAVREAAPGLVPGGCDVNSTDAREAHPIAGHEGYLSESEHKSQPIGEPAAPHPKIARQELPTLPVINEPSAVVGFDESDVASEAQSMAEQEAADAVTPADMLAAEPPAPDELNSESPDGPAIAAEPTSAAETKREPPHSVPRPGRKKRRHRPQLAGAWGAHEALLAQLDQLAWNCHTGEWAGRIADVVRELERIDDASSPRALVALGRLRDLTERDHPLLAAADNQPEAAALRRVRYAILRRLEFWEMVPEMATRRVTGQKTVSLRPDETSSRSSEELAQLLGRLERFERTGQSDDGRELAAATSRLATGDGPAAARLRHWLESNYRNSNLRIVVSADLLNRFVPKQPTVESPVRDRILGVPTRGWSSTTAQLGVRLLPDAHHVRLALEVRGLVLARTTSKSGPVTIYSHSDSTYLARKVFQLGSSGVETWPAEAAASHSPQLRGVETDYDDVPILGLVVEGIARVKHAEKEGEVRRVARRKVIIRVQEEIDAAVEPRLTEAKTTVRRRVLTPLDGLALEPTVIDLRTSENRATMRFRLAADGQLAACTPRPMALADSVASLQIHQSLLNNIGDRLGLDGQTFSLPELQQRLLEAFQLPPQAMTNEFPPDLRITFAKRDSLSVRFTDGRVELTLSVAELRKYPKSWRNFQVRVHYKPQARGLDARFVRDGTVRLWGQRFGNQPQIALRGIFSKVFSQDRDLRLIDDRTLADRRLHGLSVTQCVVTDGWLGLSLGPVRSATARREVNQLH